MNYVNGSPQTVHQLILSHFFQAMCLHFDKCTCRTVPYNHTSSPTTFCVSICPPWALRGSSVTSSSCLQAPARHKPDIDQHQRRALCALIRETSSYVQKRAATQPLRGRFGTVPSHLNGDRQTPVLGTDLRTLGEPTRAERAAACAAKRVRRRALRAKATSVVGCAGESTSTAVE